MTGYSKQVRNPLDIGAETIRRRQCVERFRTDLGPRHRGGGSYRLHQRNGNNMAARSFGTTDRGVQGVRGMAGTRVGADGLDMKLHGRAMADTKILAPIAERIRAAL